MSGEEITDHGGLYFVVEGRTGAVGIDVVDILRTRPGLCEGCPDGRAQAGPVRVRRGRMAGIAGRAVPCQDGERPGGAFRGVVPALQDEQAAALPL
ncbi:hypothetical protein GCM10028832_01730 [Streptomyces sparsus]